MDAVQVVLQWLPRLGRWTRWNSGHQQVAAAKKVMITATALSILTAVVANGAMVAAARGVGVVGVGARYLQYKPIEAGETARRGSVALPFERLSIVRAEGARLVVFGVSGELPSRTRGLWESADLANWTLMHALPSSASAVVAVDEGFLSVQCDRGACSLQFLGARGDVARTIPVPPGIQMSEKTQPVWRAANRSLLFDTTDAKIMEFLIDSGSARVLTSGLYPRISRDGSKLSFLCDGRVWVRDLREGHEVEIAAGSLLSGELNTVHFWSQDGRALYVNRETGYWFGDGYACTRIDLEKKETRRIWKAPLQCEAEGSPALRAGLLQLTLARAPLQPGHAAQL